GFMWNPDFTKLKDPKTWLAASGQIFFSLSVGFGIIINYASYLRRDDEIALSGLTAAATNEFFEVCLGGLITIPAAFIFIGMAAGDQGTFGLGFNTLPAVFAHMPATRVFGFLWFFMLFLAAITSSLSMLQPAIAFLEEGLGVGRRASVTLLGLITALGSFFVIYFSKDLLALDTMDFWVGTSLIFVLAMIEVILFAWVFGARRGYEELMRGAQMPVPRIWTFIVRWVSPLFLLIIFTAFCWNNLPGRLQALSAGGPGLYALYVIAAVMVFLLILIAIAGPRWNAEAADTSPRGWRGVPIDVEAE
ncbi:MAG: sodium:calcium symporter, partial [Planctomycetota bacterium]